MIGLVAAGRFGWSDYRAMQILKIGYTALIATEAKIAEAIDCPELRMAAAVSTQSRHIRSHAAGPTNFALSCILWLGAGIYATTLL